MTSAGIRAYVHDDNANRTQITETPSGGPTTTVATDTYDRTAANSPGLDELTTMTVDGKTTTFDDNGDGRVTTQTGSIGRTMSWDGHDRWTGGTFGTTTVVNTLDPVGKLQQRRANGNDATTTRHSYAGGSPVFVLNDDGTTITTTNIDGPAGAVATYHGPPTAGSVVTFPYFNGHGDSTATADSTGARTGLVKSYDPFGNQDVASYTNGTAEAWTGAWHKKTDISANLVHMGAWPYDPTLGRFLSVDPIDGGNPNNYEYANQDPVNGHDLTGECSWLMCPPRPVKWLVRVGAVVGKSGKWVWTKKVPIGVCALGVTAAVAGRNGWGVAAAAGSCSQGLGLKERGESYAAPSVVAGSGGPMRTGGPSAIVLPSSPLLVLVPHERTWY